MGKQPRYWRSRHQYVQPPELSPDEREAAKRVIDAYNAERRALLLAKTDLPDRFKDQQGRAVVGGAALRAVQPISDLEVTDDEDAHDTLRQTDYTDDEWQAIMRDHPSAHNKDSLHLGSTEL